MNTEERTPLGTILQIIAEQFDVPTQSLSDDTHLVDDLDADSLDYLELALAFEEELDLSCDEMDDEQMVKCRTVGQVVRFVCSHLMEAS